MVKTYNSISEIEKDVFRRITNLIFDTHREIIMNTPVNTGRLRQSIKVDDDSQQETVIGTNLSYAPYVESGVRPYVITPKNAPYLVFTIDGQKIFTKKVNHPGSEGRFMFLKGVNYFEKRMKREFK